jgi:hypothetical protein
VPESGLEGTDGKPLTIAFLLPDGLDGRALDDEHDWLLS